MSIGREPGFNLEPPTDEKVVTPEQPELRASDDCLTPQFLPEVIERRARDNIAVGPLIVVSGSKDVHDHPEDPEQVRAITRGRYAESNPMIVGRYYLTRLLHLLYPDNIPDMTAYSLPEHLFANWYVDMQRVHIDRSRQKEVNSRLPERIALIQKLESLGVDVDNNSGNFSFDTRGNFWYIDSLDPWGSRGLPELIRNYDLKKLQGRINQLPDEQKAEASEYLRLLEENFSLDHNK